MKALVLSDSHGSIEAVAPIVQANAGAVRHVLHLGDGCDDMAVFVHQYPDLVFHIVSGNCDSGDNFPIEQIVEICGKRIFITHGHKYGVKSSYDRICYAALEVGADICLFGHTHVPVKFEYEGILFMNPGAVFARDDSCPRYGVIDLTKEPAVCLLNRRE